MRTKGGTPMSPYMLEKMADHSRQELARSSGKRDWKAIFRLS